MNESSCASLSPCAHCHSFGTPDLCDNITLCRNIHYVFRDTMLDGNGASDWINCTARNVVEDFCNFRFVVDPPRNMLFIDTTSRRCTGDPAVVAGLVAGALLLMWLVLAVGLGLPGRIWDAVRSRGGRDLDRTFSMRSGSSTRSSTRGSTRSGYRHNYSVRSN